MLGFNTKDYAEIKQEEVKEESSDSEQELEEREVNRLTFKDVQCPDIINYSNLEHDKLIKKYLTVYNGCDGSRKIVDKLNIVLYKDDVDKFMQTDFLFSEGMMCYFINYLINYQRLLYMNDKAELQTYFLVYQAKEGKTYQTYHPKMSNLQQFQQANTQLLQPSLEEFKQNVKINNIREYKYVALVINGNSKWFLCLFDLKFKEAYYFDFAQDENAEIKQYDHFFEDLVLKVVGLDLRGQVIHDIVTSINDPGDKGDLIFYTLYRILLSKKRIDPNGEFLVTNDINRAKSRCTWVVLTQMLERDQKVDARELKRNLKKFQTLQAIEEKKQSQIDKNSKERKNEIRLKLKEQLLFVHMLNDARQEATQIKEETEEDKKYQILVKKLSVFNVYSKGNKPVSKMESWVTGKQSKLPDHFYNFTSSIPEIREYKRDYRALVEPIQYYSKASYGSNATKQGAVGYNHSYQSKDFQRPYIAQPQSLQASMISKYQQGSSNFSSQNLYSGVVSKPDSRDLKRRWHYAQNLQKMQPTQQSIPQFNIISPQNIYPKLKNRYYM